MIYIVLTSEIDTSQWKATAYRIRIISSDLDHSLTLSIAVKQCVCNKCVTAMERTKTFTSLVSEKKYPAYLNSNTNDIKHSMSVT